MEKSQLQADIGESKASNNRPPDDKRTPGELHRTTGRERRHRDRGNASDSDAWRGHKIRDAD